MYHILISLIVPQDFPAIINGDIEDAEILIAERISQGLLELFGEVLVRDIEAEEISGQDQGLYFVKIYIEAELAKASISMNNRRWLHVGNQKYTDIEPGIKEIELTVEGIAGVAIVDHFRKVLMDKVVVSKDTPLQQSIVHFRIIEEPLTSQNVNNALSAINDLHVKCLLIYRERFSDLIEYTQTHDIRFIKEANLVITKLSYSSPLEIKLDAGIKDIAEALRLAIDGVIQVPLRYKAAKQEIEAKDLEIKLKEQEAQSSFEDQEQSRAFEAQKAELEKQTEQLRLAQLQLEIEKQRLDLQKAILESEHQRIDLAFDTASKIVERLAPNADVNNKAMLIRSLVPQLLQLGDVRGLELYLPSPPKLNEP